MSYCGYRPRPRRYVYPPYDPYVDPYYRSDPYVNPYLADSYLVNTYVYPQPIPYDPYYGPGYYPDPFYRTGNVAYLNQGRTPGSGVYNYALQR